MREWGGWYVKVSLLVLMHLGTTWSHKDLHQKDTDQKQRMERNVNKESIEAPLNLFTSESIHGRISSMVH